MSRKLDYTVSAPPDVVLGSIAAASTPASLFGFALADRASTEVVGGVTGEGPAFSLRRARRFGTPPRVVTLRGRVEPEGTGTRVVASYGLHPVARIARACLVLLFLAFALLVLPGAASQPQLLWLVVGIGVVVALMLLPLMRLASADRARLRDALEELLRRSGAVTPHDAR
jgi:hypothetical protein